jgi:hypothetical protein
MSFSTLTHNFLSFASYFIVVAGHCCFGMDEKSFAAAEGKSFASYGSTASSFMFRDICPAANVSVRLNVVVVFAGFLQYILLDVVDG